MGDMNAEDIVRALAAIADPTVADRDYSPSSDCGLCHADDGPPYRHKLDDPVNHEPTCPWRMAREYVTASLSV